MEFTFVALLLFTLVFGIITYAYMMSFRQAISQAAAEGARSAAVAPRTLTLAQKETAARNAVNEALASYDVSCSGTTLLRNSSAAGTCGVTILPCVGNTAQSCVSVSLTYNYRANPLLPSFPGLGLALPERLIYVAVAEIN